LGWERGLGPGGLGRKLSQASWLGKDREPPLLDVDNDVWHKPCREPGDLAEARLFAFLRGSIWYEACQHRSSHGPRDTDPLQHVAFLLCFPLSRVLSFSRWAPLYRWIRLELPAPQPWLFVSPLMVEEGGRWKRKKEGEHCRHDGTGFHALKYLSVGSTRASLK
jgi:hypothetical protein